MAKTFRVLKWIGIGLLAVILLALLAIYAISQLHISRSYEAKPIPAAALAEGDLIEGKRLSAIYGCSGCHRSNLQGGEFIDETLFATVYASNLTRKLEDYDDTEFVQAVQQGIRPDGSGLVIMPSRSFSLLRDDEIADILAYLHSVPAGGENYPRPFMGPVARAFFVIGDFKTAPALAEDTNASLPWFIDGHEEGRRKVFGACSECHGSDLRGEPFSGSPDLSIAAAYELSDFKKLMRTGKGAGGRDLGLMSEVALGRFTHFTDKEIAEIHDYLTARAEEMN